QDLPLPPSQGTIVMPESAIAMEKRDAERKKLRLRILETLRRWGEGGGPWPSNRDARTRGATATCHGSERRGGIASARTIARSTAGARGTSRTRAAAVTRP